MEKRFFYPGKDEVLTILNGEILEGVVKCVEFFLNEQKEYEVEKYLFLHNGSEVELPGDQVFYRDIDALNCKEPCTTVGFTENMATGTGNKLYFDGTSVQKFVPEEHIRRFRIVSGKRGREVLEGFLPELYQYASDALAYNTQKIHKDDGTVETIPGKLERILLTDSQRLAVSQFETAFMELKKAGVDIVTMEGNHYYVNRKDIREYGGGGEYEEVFVPTKQLKSSFYTSMDACDFITIDFKK